MVRAARNQVRVAPRGGVFGLDLAACLQLADAFGAPRDLVAQVLAEIEPFVVAHYAPEED